MKSFLKSARRKGQAYLTEISGTANAWEEGDHYIVQVTADDKEKVTLKLGERKAQIASGTDVVLAMSSPP